MGAHAGSLESRTGRGDEGLPPGALVAGQYEVEHLLGRGGMGEVFAAVHVRTGRAVAIKWMLPRAAASADSVRRFLAEARITARIEHPNVVQVFDCGEHGGAPFLIMERLRGETLRERLDREGRLAPAEVLRLMLPTMRGVAEAHREGVLHRDLKPDNVFLCRGKDGSEREPKVVDFGIGKLRDDEAQLNVTRAGMVIGTPSYMAPEQLAGSRDPDPRVDVYALGVVMYEALAGRCPFQADGTFALIAQIATSTPPVLASLAPETPPELLAIVERAMHRDPDRRFPSVAAMIASIERMAPTRLAPSVSFAPAAVAEPTVAATVLMHVEPPAPHRSRAPSRGVIAALLMGGIVGALGWTALDQRFLHAPVASSPPPSAPSELREEEPDAPRTAIALSPPIEIGLPEPVAEPASERAARPRSRAREAAREVAAATRAQLGTNGALILE